MKKYDYSKRENCFFSVQDPSLPRLSEADMASFFAKEEQLKKYVENLSFVQSVSDNYRRQLSKIEALEKQRPLSAQEIKTKKALENYFNTVSEKMTSSQIMVKIDGLYQELESYYQPSRPGPGG